MEAEKYTNKNLATDYFTVVAQQCGDVLGYVNMQRMIAALPTDLPSFYRDNGSFSKLAVKGIGVKTKGILELILEYGVEEAKTLAENNKIDEAIRSRIRKPTRPRKVQETSPSGDDSV